MSKWRDLSPEDRFALWAPDGAPWSPWVKPLIFTERGAAGSLDEAAVKRIDVSWAPDPTREEVAGELGYREAPERRRVAVSDRAALVIDLPRAEGVRVGVALVARGYRPIPLYNGSSGGLSHSRVSEIATVIREAGPWLAPGRLALDAPPAFLLDRSRLAGTPRPGQFDGRWHVFPQDVPSANALRARGIARVIVRAEFPDVGDDLAHVLLEWHKGGITLSISTPAAPEAPFTPPAPSRFRGLLRRASVVMGLRRSSAGGFGGMVPVPQSSGGS